MPRLTVTNADVSKVSLLPSLMEMWLGETLVVRTKDGGEVVGQLLSGERGSAGKQAITAFWGTIIVGTADGEREIDLLDIEHVAPANGSDEPFSA